jgi:hypothetical protein
MELSAGFPDMEAEIDKMATTFLDQIGLQSSKTTATSILMINKKNQIKVYFVFSQRIMSGISWFIM